MDKPDPIIGDRDVMPTSVGSKADIKADVDIAKVLGGYFSRPEVAQAFLDKAIKDIERGLPEDVKLADFGGGKGFLTRVVADYLGSQGHRVDATVVDANDKFLEAARKEGLKTERYNLEDGGIENVDLVIMRAVNHYNSPEKQLGILKSALKSLKKGGVMVAQISSGSEGNCRLRSDIVNLKSLGRAAEGEEYHWTSIEEYMGFLEKAGFSENSVVGYAPDCQWSPEEQWDRFHENEFKEAAAAKDNMKLKEINERRASFLKEAYVVIERYIRKYGNENIGVEFDQGKAMIKYKYPIIKSVKNTSL